jgi:hypothetical protein
LYIRHLFYCLAIFTVSEETVVGFCVANRNEIVSAHISLFYFNNQRTHDG